MMDGDGDGEGGWLNLVVPKGSKILQASRGSAMFEPLGAQRFKNEPLGNRDHGVPPENALGR